MKTLHLMKGLLTVLILFYLGHAYAQDPARFQKEIEILSAKDYCFSPDKELLLFTGSSSIRMWKDAEEAFPGHHVINNGFGGSHFSDLIHYYDELIAPFEPDILFIYEGDNDIASQKEPEDILKEARQLVEKIRKDKPDTKVVLISAKPSVARWELKEQYMKLNAMLEKLAKKTKGVEFADVWEAMTDENGEVYSDIFIDDNLHLNEKGYDIWEDVLARHLN